MSIGIKRLLTTKASCGRQRPPELPTRRLIKRGNAPFSQRCRDKSCVTETISQAAGASMRNFQQEVLTTELLNKKGNALLTKGATPPPAKWFEGTTLDA